MLSGVNVLLIMSLLSSLLLAVTGLSSGWPKFSFDTLPVFFHATSTQTFSASQLSMLLNASIVQFDKKQFEATMPGAAFEARAEAAAMQVRLPHTGCVLYRRQLRPLLT